MYFVYFFFCSILILLGIFVWCFYLLTKAIIQYINSPLRKPLRTYLPGSSQPISEENDVDISAINEALDIRKASSKEIEKVESHGFNNLGEEKSEEDSGFHDAVNKLGKIKK